MTQWHIWTELTTGLDMESEGPAVVRNDGESVGVRATNPRGTLGLLADAAVYGVYGSSPDGIGVFGASSGGPGVAGRSGSHPGVTGNSDNSAGVFGGSATSDNSTGGQTKVRQVRASTESGWNSEAS